MAISLAEILDQRQIALHLRSRRQAGAIQELVALFEKTGTVARPLDFLTQVEAREKTASTLAEKGLAFPHARTDLVDDVALAIGRSRAGIPWKY